MKILFCSSEIVPFAKTGGLADVAGALPLALEDLGLEVAVVMPKYKSIDAQKFSIKEIGKDIYAAKIGKNICVYFIENNKYFERDGLYGEKTGDYLDNLERFSFFSLRALQLMRQIDFKADIIHCNDWQTALIPIYLKNFYKDKPFFKTMKTVLTVHNLAYQGLFDKKEYPKLDLDWKYFNIDGLEFYDKINILKGGLVFSDIVTTVSQTYAQEIQTKEFGCGLEGLLAKRSNSIFGVINGLDYNIWDPAKDKMIYKVYSEAHLEDKYLNKTGLQKECALNANLNTPLIGFVGRLSSQKGLDILAEAIEQIARLDLQMVFLGTGEIKYHLILENIAKKYPKNISLHIKFDDTLAHKIYAGCDMFLMPSGYEPCGLGQMISLKYATIPIVFKTGGLADTIVDFDPLTEEGNGFVFDYYHKDDLLKTLKCAIYFYKDKTVWHKLLKRAVKYDFSWKESAKKYLDIYKKCLSLE
ncbi:MAG: glycogen synthase GlgA [Candidatus Omnitrophota bacterium]|nr:glycogen synthase GlgA [Candidatus Omnitrophota bacterium]